MLTKICKHCGETFEVKDTKKGRERKFCGPICSRRWAANNRSDSWRKKASEAKQGKNNPMYGVTQTNPNSLANLKNDRMLGKKHTIEAKQKISESLKGITRSEETKRKISEANSYWRPDDPQYEDFKKYRRKVYYWSEKNDLSQLSNYSNRSRNGYHLDHKYSITEGFKNDVPPKVIGNIANLEFLPAKANISKGTGCSLTLEELLCLIQNT
jgi:hypothetical protein